MKTREKLWLFIAQLDRTDLCHALATTAWAAERMGVTLECYLECERQGNLFAKTGSTIQGGHHFQQFNYLHALYDVQLLILGEQSVFASSAQLFGDEILIEANDLNAYYDKLFALCGAPDAVLFAPAFIDAQQTDSTDFSNTMHNAPEINTRRLDIAPYLHPEIFFSQSAAYPPQMRGEILPSLSDLPVRTLWCDTHDGEETIDGFQPQDSLGSLTLRLARRWQTEAKAVAFGDPDAIRAQLPKLIRERRVSVFAPVRSKPAREITLASYTECASSIAQETAQLALEIGNPVLVGRQTGDADLFAWGAHGVSMQIMDPNRPAFPVVSSIQHPWASLPGTLWDDEPDDATLLRWAKGGRVLSSLIFHSGEMAHNEAMVNLMELTSVTKLKFGLATHLARYETCPQFWEMMQVPIAHGGVRGLIEPVLHSGGLGVMGEKDCPHDQFLAHCTQALHGIEAIAGKNNCPRGHYFFCDTDLDTLTEQSPLLYQAVADAGMTYAISSARPGRNRLLDAPIPVLTQTSRTQCQGSPFVRITSEEDIRESGYTKSPGWFIGVLDSPVISFMPYIWRKGSRFMALADKIQNGGMTNVLPNTIARYASILQREGML